MVSGRVRVGEGTGGDGDEGNPGPAEATEIAATGGVRLAGMRTGEGPMEASPLAELQGGGQRRRRSAAKLRLARARMSHARPGPSALLVWTGSGILISPYRDGGRWILDNIVKRGAISFQITNSKFLKFATVGFTGCPRSMDEEA